MAEIIADIYVADQILEDGSALRMKADTMLVYIPIIEKHGYTLEEYKKSINYYLQKDDTYKQIHIRARNNLSKRGKELRKEIEVERKSRKEATIIHWWARTYVTKTPNNELVLDPFLRAFKWLAMSDTKIKWNILDNTVTDMPRNAIWWLNNLNPKTLKFGERIVYELNKDKKRTQEESVNTPDKEENTIKSYTFIPQRNKNDFEDSNNDVIKMRELKELEEKGELKK